MTLRASHTGGELDVEYREASGRHKVDRALDRLMEEHERGNPAKLEVWVSKGSFKCVGRRPWDWRDDTED